MKRYLITFACLLMAAAAEAQQIEKNSPPVKIEEPPATAVANEGYDYVDKQAEFPGGMEKFYAYLFQNVKVPASAKGKFGRMFITFVVSKDGAVTDVNVIKGIDRDVDEAEVKAVKSSPKWKPAMKGNLFVNQTFTLPLIINIK